jgi:hypothetical protein
LSVGDGWWLSLFCCSVPNYVMYFVGAFSHNRNLYIDKYLL